MAASIGRSCDKESGMLLVLLVNIQDFRVLPFSQELCKLYFSDVTAVVHLFSSMQVDEMSDFPI